MHPSGDALQGELNSRSVKFFCLLILRDLCQLNLRASLLGRFRESTLMDKITPSPAALEDEEQAMYSDRPPTYIKGHAGSDGGISQRYRPSMSRLPSDTAYDLPVDIRRLMVSVKPSLDHRQESRGKNILPPLNRHVSIVQFR